MVLPPERDLAQLTSTDIAPLESALPEICSDVWRDFACSLYMTLLRVPNQTEPREKLAALAVELLLGIAHDLGGRQPYIPSGYKIAAADKAAAVRREFTGNNHRRLAQRHGVSDSRIRQILAGK